MRDDVAISPVSISCLKRRRSRRAWIAGSRWNILAISLPIAPPGGDIGKLIAKLFQQEPKIQARRDLRRFKQLMETGEISTARAPQAAPQG